MTKTKKSTEPGEETDSRLELAPPETHFLAERYEISLPLSDPHFADPSRLRLHVVKILERRLGDEVQLNSIKVKKPHLLSKTKAKLKKQEPCARLYVTVKF